MAKLILWPFKRMAEYIFSGILPHPPEKSLRELHCRNDTCLENQRRLNEPLYLERYGYKVYSQNDEDGYISEIFRRIGITNKCFIEFGVEIGMETNTHYLLFQGWNGLWIEGSKQYSEIASSIFARPVKEKRLRIINDFITAENINELISVKGEITGEIDLLSVDIDGNDYWVWKAISCVSPRVVIIEYNAKFPPPVQWIMPYNPEHTWDSDDYFSASLQSLQMLGEDLGYQLVGTSMSGVNAFFVRKDLAGNRFATPATAENFYHPMTYPMYRTGGHQSKKYIGV